MALTRGEATRAIAATRLRRETPLLVFMCAGFAIVALVVPHREDAALRALTFFGTLYGIVAALVQRGSGRLRELELCEESAPLLGRELARATALVPCIIVSSAACIYWAAQAATGSALTSALFLPALAGVNASTIVACSATVRSGYARAIYVAMACAAGVSTYVLLLFAGPSPRTRIAATVAFAAVAGFIALRQYGESLARYDPIPD